MAQPAMTEQEMAEAENLRLRAALAYAQRGWAVFACHTPTEGGCSCHRSDCQDVGKHPRTQNGFKDATVDEAVIRKWWGMWPDANVGIACGASKLAVLDIDPRHGGDESLADLRVRHGGGWLETAIVQTGGGGTHYYYRAPAGLRNRAGVFPGIDVRAAGGYVIAPPSVHVAGNYVWEVTVKECALADWPAEVFDGARANRGNPATVVTGLIPAGERNTVLTSLAGTMRRRGMSAEAIHEALRVENRQRCQPPLAESEVRTIASSVGGMEPASDILLRVKGGAPMYSALRKHAVEPPIWVLRIGETDVRLDLEELSTHRALRKAAIAQANVVLPRMKDYEWDDQLAVLMAAMEVVDAPADASERGLAWGCIRSFLQLRSEVDERFEQGRPLEREGMVYASGAMLKGALRMRGINYDQRELWATIRAHGGDACRLRIGETTYAAWRIPVEALA